MAELGLDDLDVGVLSQKGKRNESRGSKHATEENTPSLRSGELESRGGFVYIIVSHGLEPSFPTSGMKGLGPNHAHF